MVKVIAPSTKPSPAGVGEIIINKYPILQPAMTVPIDNGVLNAINSRNRIETNRIFI